MKKVRQRSKVLAVLAVAMHMAACASQGPGADIGDAEPSEEIGVTQQSLVAPVTVNTIVSTVVTPPQTSVRMYNASSGNSVLRYLAPSSAVKIVINTPTNGRWRVEYGSPAIWGWVADAELATVHFPNANLSATRTNALARGRNAMGFSYWWSNARWPTTGTTMMPSSNIGICSGNCGGNPQCTHAATGGTEYGADCSGFISTIWGFPDSDPNTNPANNGYATSAYSTDRAGQWSTVTLANALPGDAVVAYVAGGTQHIWMVGTPRNGSGYFVTYECRGCAQGCYNYSRRVLNGDATWHAIRRATW